jgi:hypothetical protein
MEDGGVDVTEESVIPVPGRLYRFVGHDYGGGWMYSKPHEAYNCQMVHIPDRSIVLAVSGPISVNNKWTKVVFGELVGWVWGSFYVVKEDDEDGQGQIW